MKTTIEGIEEIQNKIRQLADCLDLKKKENIIKELEREIAEPDFWQDKEKAVRVNTELANLKEEVSAVRLLERELSDLKEIEKLSTGESLQAELEKGVDNLEKKVKKEEFRAYLSGKYDGGNAILSIYSGAGGQDAQDWATMLLRMYQRYCQKKGFGVKTLSQSFGEAGGPDGRIGTKAAILEIKGRYAYGILRRESGVHRLVRISPFSSKKLRHTSFALVEILPEISESIEEINIRAEDLKIETFKASGPGGQYVQKTESAVRITHLATGIVVSCQSERSQGQNKEQAMKLLYSKIYQLMEQEKVKELEKIKGKRVEVEWGSQIRSYVVHPYKLVKDLRTDVEISNIEDVLDGNLDDFINEEIKLPND
ncbi:MAG: peptide chain release factor 2 [Candidatus Parcubacteria bacterium]|nr:peptide chain release factor 2 [Candidatus Parcubacteria bacterium]